MKLLLKNGKPINRQKYVFSNDWEEHQSDDCLKIFLLRNFSEVLPYRSGLEDEMIEYLKYYGQTIWEEGQTKIKFLGNIYEVIE